MKKAICLVLFLLMTFLTQADVVDDFESYDTGNIADVASPPWMVLANEAANEAPVIAAETDGNKYLRACGAAIALPAAITDGTVATAFYRIYVPAGNNPDCSIGITDTASPTGTWGDLEAYVTAAGSGPSTYTLRARNSGSNTDISTINADTWYNIWLVIDASADTYDVYVTTGSDDATGTTPLADNFVFREGLATENLVGFQVFGRSDATTSRAVLVDDLSVTTGVDITIPSGIKPYGPSVAQTPDIANSDINVTLQWMAAIDPAEVYAVNPDIVDQYIFMSDPVHSDPNLMYVGATGADPGTDTPDSEYGPLNLVPGKTYKWAVVEAMDGYEQTFNVGDNIDRVDPNNIVGSTWSFTTILLTPTFTEDPADQLVFPGETAVFSAALADETGVTYKWYDSVGEVDDLTDKIAGSDTATLTIYDAQDADEETYFCRATSSAGSSDSQSAKLQIKRLRSSYSFESISIVDGNSVTPDSIDGFDMALTSEDAAATGLPALEANVADASLGTYSLLFDNGDHTADPNGQYAQMDAGVVDYQDLTITLWVYWDGGSNWQRIFDFGNDTTHYMFLTPSNGSEARFVLNNGSGEQIVSTSPLTTGEWLFVAVTLEGDTGRLYVNAEPKGTNTSVSINPEDFSPALNYIGKSQFTADAEFDGMIDELKIYNYALDAETIASQYYGVTGIRACYDPDFAGNEYDLDTTGASYCKVDLADVAVFVENWLKNGLYVAP